MAAALYRRYLQVVSSALATERSSGSLVGELPLVWSICTLTDEPLGGGATPRMREEAFRFSRRSA